jgi:hypothetical protein
MINHMNNFNQLKVHNIFKWLSKAILVSGIKNVDRVLMNSILEFSKKQIQNNLVCNLFF